MKTFYKALDHFRGIIRSGRKPFFVKIDKFYWLVDGYAVFKVPESEMELNPALFKPFEGDLEAFLSKAENGVDLKATQLIKHSEMGFMVPYKGTDFTIWFNKSLLDIFPTGTRLKGTGSVDAAVVQDHDVTIGLILPVKNDRDDITPFI